VGARGGVRGQEYTNVHQIRQRYKVSLEITSKADKSFDQSTYSIVHNTRVSVGISLAISFYHCN
jgi:hypothetical protein